MLRPRFFGYLAAIIGIATLGWLVFGYFGLQALFFDQVVEERVPVATVGQAEDGIRGIPVASSTTETQPSKPAGPRLLALGAFTQGDTTYAIRGTAAITEEQGLRTLSLTDFAVTNGPDLFVYLTSAESTENQTVKTAVRSGAFVNLGALKGNKGNQTYAIPPEIRLDERTVVTIWCRRFARNFGAAAVR